MKVQIEQIAKNPYDPRQDYGDLNGLKSSIQKHGMLHSFLLRPGKQQGEYELVFGGRRFECLKQLGASEVEAEVREFKDADMAILALCENVHRKDYNPIELAKSYRIGLTTTGYSMEQFSEIVGESVGKISMYLSILELPEHITAKAKEYTLADLTAMAKLEKISRTLRIEYENVIKERSISPYFAEQIVSSCKKIFDSKLPQNKKMMLCGDILTQEYSTIASKNARAIGVYAEQRLEQALVNYDKNLGKVAKAIAARNHQTGPVRARVKNVRSLEDIENVDSRLNETTDILRQATLHLERTEKKGYYANASKRNQNSFRVAVNQLASKLEGILKNGN